MSLFPRSIRAGLHLRRQHGRTHLAPGLPVPATISNSSLVAIPATSTSTSGHPPSWRHHRLTHMCQQMQPFPVSSYRSASSSSHMLMSYSHDHPVSRSAWFLLTPGPGRSSPTGLAWLSQPYPLLTSEASPVHLPSLIRDLSSHFRFTLSPTVLLPAARTYRSPLVSICLNISPPPTCLRGYNMYILYASVSLRFGFSILSHTFAYTSPVSPSVNLSFHSPDYRTQTCLTMISFRFIPALRLAIAFALLALSSTAFAKPALPASRGHPDLRTSSCRLPYLSCFERLDRRLILSSS
jgi:hypothetical protein